MVAGIGWAFQVNYRKSFHGGLCRLRCRIESQSRSYVRGFPIKMQAWHARYANEGIGPRIYGRGWQFRSNHRSNPEAAHRVA